MSLAWKRARVYARISLLLVPAVCIGLVLFKNREHRVPFWFFGLTDTAQPINVVALIGYTAAATLLLYWLARMSYRLWHDLREVRRLSALQGVSAEQERRRLELEDRERRVQAAESLQKGKDASAGEGE